MKNRRPRLALVVLTSLTLLVAACGPIVLLLNNLVNDPIGDDPGDPVYTAQSFVNWESPHVHPLDIAPGRTRLYAVNTADNRLEVFSLEGELPVSAASIPVGLDPVTVRVRDETQAWVVNHISDSVSIVDLATGNVVRTLNVGDEPTDVGFAAEKAFVVCSQPNQVWVFDLNRLDVEPAVIEINGLHPRALAVSPDGSLVYVAVFESGNQTTIVPIEQLTAPTGPYGGRTPIPVLNDPLSALQMEQLPPGPAISPIVKKDRSSGAWLDENGMDWSSLVTWDVHDHDVAVIDPQTLAVSYIRSLMNLNMQLAVRADGQLTVVGTEAMNHQRFEPRITGRFVHSMLALVDPAAPAAPRILDLNPHLADAYATGVSTLPMQQRALSVADPRGLIWAPDGTTGYVAGMGSNNVIRIDADGRRLGQIDVGAGPTGLQLGTSGDRLYVLNRFDATISVIDPVRFTELARVAFFDPTPAAVREGRPFLYNARLTSGLGVTACASCHIDGRMDQLAWDLGHPGGEVKPFNQSCDHFELDNLGFRCEDFHPLKGPMVTQTLQGIVGTEPLHWRGDRENLFEFNPAFVGLNGNDRELTGEEMRQFEDFVATLTFPPNPFRNLDNSLTESLMGGNPRRGREIYVNQQIDTPGTLAGGVGLITCNRCHQLPTGTSRRVVPGLLLNSPESIKVPQLRDTYRKGGFDKASSANSRGFGFVHTGEFGTIEEFLSIDRFVFAPGPRGVQQRKDVIAFTLSLSVDTHAGVGRQVTLTGANNADSRVRSLLDTMQALADSGDVGLVVRGRQGGTSRGYAYLGDGVFQSDRAGQQVAAATLRSAAAPGAELTWTLVPLGSQQRIGIDRDEDGVLDGDE